MKKKLVTALLLCVLIISSVLLGGCGCDMAELYEYYNTNDDNNLCCFGATWRAQTFTPSQAHRITSVKLRLYRTGSPGTFTVSIRATDGNGHPIGSDLCSGTKDGNTLPPYPDWEWYEITLGAGYNLDADTKYAIVAKAPSGDEDNIVHWRMDATYPTYDGGCGENSVDSGDNWNSYPDVDLMFEEWGILRAIFIPAPASAIGKTLGPSVVIGITVVAPTAASAVGATVNPYVIIFPPYVRPAPASAKGLTVDPLVVIGGQTITPSPISAVGGRANPTVVLGSVVIIPSVIDAIGGRANPTVVLGSMSITPTPVSAVGETTVYWVGRAMKLLVYTKDYSDLRVYTKPYSNLIVYCSEVKQ